MRVGEDRRNGSALWQPEDGNIVRSFLPLARRYMSHFRHLIEFNEEIIPRNGIENAKHQLSTVQ